VATLDDGPGPPQKRPLKPVGFTAAMLADQTSEPAQMFIKTCAQCHDLPAPSSHTKEEWPDIVTQMINRLRRRKFFSSQSLFVPGNDKANQITDYLSRHALEGADANAHADTPAGLLFQKKCTQCHAMPDPRLHSPAEWPAVIERMRGNIHRMQREPISDHEAEELARYLSVQSGR